MKKYRVKTEEELVSTGWIKRKDVDGDTEYIHPKYEEEDILQIVNFMFQDLGKVEEFSEIPDASFKDKYGEYPLIIGDNTSCIATLLTFIWAPEALVEVTDGNK